MWNQFSTQRAKFMIDNELFLEGFQGFLVFVSGMINMGMNEIIYT